MKIKNEELISKGLTFVVMGMKKHKILFNAPVRLEILELLEKKPSNMNEISNYINQTHRNIERHIKILKENGYITTKKEGKFVISKLTKKGRTLSL